MAFSVTMLVLRLTVLTAIFGCFFLKAASRAACILSSAAVYTTTSEADWASAPEEKVRQAPRTTSAPSRSLRFRMTSPPLIPPFHSLVSEMAESVKLDHPHYHKVTDWRHCREIRMT